MGITAMELETFNLNPLNVWHDNWITLAADRQNL